MSDRIVYTLSMVEGGFKTKPVTHVDKKYIFYKAKLYKASAPQATISVKWNYKGNEFEALIDKNGDWEMI